MNVTQKPPDLPSKKLKQHLSTLQGRFAREYRQVQARHERGVPGQPEAAQRVDALADLLVSVYQMQPETKQRGALLLVTDARLAGASAYALSLLGHIETVDPSLNALYAAELFLCRAAAGEEAEEAWRAIGFSDAVSSLLVVTARITQLMARNRFSEAEDFVCLSNAERLIAEVHPEGIAVPAYRALARLALHQQKPSAAHHYFVNALALAREMDIVHCLMSRDVVLGLHREHIKAIASTPVLQQESEMEAHRAYIGVLRQVLERDENPELRAEFTEALGGLSSCLETLGYLHEAAEARKAQLQAIEETIGGHNPSAAAACERLAHLFALMGRGKDSREQLRAAHHIYADFGERAKAERLRKALDDPANGTLLSKH